MNRYNFQDAALLAPENVSLDAIEAIHGRDMRRLVAALRDLPVWERLRPTPALAQREWRLMVRRDTEMKERRRTRRRYQTRFE
jgi:hypothetical protein